MAEKSGFNKTIDRILPPRVSNGRTYKPDITTGNDGKKQGFNAPRPGRIHGGVDINYHLDSGAPVAQNGVNKEHPDVGTPVSGEVIKIDRERWGMVEIKDANGYIHELKHLDEISRSLNEGDMVSAGQVIGTMGGRGPGGSNEYDQHVHYSVIAPDGKTKVNPEAHWNNNLSEGKDSSSSFPWQGKMDFKPTSILDNATQQRLKNLPQGITISSGETLRREGDKVWRIGRDGGTRGYFISQ